MKIVVMVDDETAYAFAHKVDKESDYSATAIDVIHDTLAKLFNDESILIQCYKEEE